MATKKNTDTISEEKIKIQNIFANKLSDEIIKSFSSTNTNQNIFLRKISDGSTAIDNKIYKGGKKIIEFSFDIDKALSINSMIIPAFNNKLKKFMLIGTIISCVHKKNLNTTMVDVYVYYKKPNNPDEDFDENQELFNGDKFEFVNIKDKCIRYEVQEFKKNIFSKNIPAENIVQRSASNTRPNIESNTRPNIEFNTRPNTGTNQINNSLQIFKNVKQQIEEQENKLKELYLTKQKIDAEIKEIEENAKKYFTSSNGINIISHAQLESTTMRQNIAEDSTNDETSIKAEASTSTVAKSSAVSSTSAVSSLKTETRPSVLSSLKTEIRPRAQSISTTDTSYASALKANL